MPATKTSQPRAAGVIAWNWPATVSSIRWRSCSGVGGACAADGLGAAVWRTSGPTGTNGIPRVSIHSRKSGGAQIRTSWPSSINCNANATIGWTSPRDPIVDSSTRMGTPSVRMNEGSRPANRNSKPHAHITRIRYSILLSNPLFPGLYLLYFLFVVLAHRNLGKLKQRALGSLFDETDPRRRYSRCRD